MALDFGIEGLSVLTGTHVAERPLERTPFADAHGYAPLARANASPEAGWRRHTLAAGVPLNFVSLGVMNTSFARELRMPAINILEKFGDAYAATERTFRLGIDIRITRRIAQRFQDRTVLETCTGGGFTTIALAEAAASVVTIEIDPEHLSQARTNVTRAQLQHKVRFVEGDALSDDLLSEFQNIDAAFLDPDWAVTGPEHIFRFRQSNMRPLADVLLQKALFKTDDIPLILPPTIDLSEIEELPVHELQRIFLNGDHALYCVYFGALAECHSETELHV